MNFCFGSNRFSQIVKLVLLILSFLFFETGFCKDGVVRFIPTGTVKNIHQLRVQFSSDMVALGDPRSDRNLFKIICNGEDITQTKNSKLAYTTKWVDSKNWVLEFKHPLPVGTSCTSTLKSNVKNLIGQIIEADGEFYFSTSGPSIRSIFPKYEDIEPDQHFLVWTDGSVDRKSVEENAYFEVEGIPGKVGVKFVEGKLREDVIKVAVRANWELNNHRTLLEKNPKVSISKLKLFDTFYLITADRRFPEGSKLIFHWPKGIRSQEGVLTTEPQQNEFKVIQPFEAHISCERLKPEKGCNPIQGLTLYFTQKVDRRKLIGTKIISKQFPDKVWNPNELSKNELSKNNQDPYVLSLFFNPPFPESASMELLLPNDLKDQLNRPLANKNKFPLKIDTDEYSPLIKFSAPFGILELKSDPMLPVSLRNIEETLSLQQHQIEGKTLSLSHISSVADIIQWYKKVLKKESNGNNYENRNVSLFQPHQGAKFQLPKSHTKREFELIGIPFKKPGFYIVEIESPLLGMALTGQAPMYVSAGALVTDLSVHFKKGRDSSLIWVTQLSNAMPVSGAQISLHDTTGKILAKGVTNKEGLFQIKSLQYPCSFTDDSNSNQSDSLPYENCEVFAFAQKGDDFSFSSSEWDKGIESFRFNINKEYIDLKWGPAAFHTVMSRNLAQPGDIIDFKHILRENHESSFSFLNEKRLPKNVLIVHQGSFKTYTLPFLYDRTTGNTLTQFKIPKEAALGRYKIYLSNKDSVLKGSGPTSSLNEDISQSSDQQNEASDAFDWTSLNTGEFVVSEYRLPLMKSNIKIQGEPLISPSEVDVDLSAHYLSGGPAKDLKVKLRSILTSSNWPSSFSNVKDYTFFSDPVRPGVSDRERKRSDNEDFIYVQDYSLNSEGGLLATIKKIPKIVQSKLLSVEMEYSDPSGEIRTASATSTLYPSNNIIGLKSEGWSFKVDSSKVSGVIMSPIGKILSQQPYLIEAFRSNFITHRKKLVGGFYSYDSKIEIVPLGKICEGKSDLHGQFKCFPKNLPAGEIILQAKSWDEKKRTSYAQVQITLFEEGNSLWFSQSDSDRIDLITEKNRYEPGEKAKIIIQSPYPQSQLLVTVEREGVLDSFVTEIQSDKPFVEIPIKETYAPNVYISVLALRGRVGESKPTSMVDLSRPSMKMGLIGIDVGWKAHELLVNIKTDRLNFTVGEKVQATIQVKSANGKALSSGAEVAVVVVDESLLRLKENNSWNILSSMMSQRPLSVETSSGQNQVIGRRHFGLKAKEPGGGGGSSSLGADSIRNLFDPILLWKPQIKLDSSGKAQFTIPLNDSITSFRIVGIATAGSNQFGSGSLNIESTKDLILYSGIAPHARSGDQVKNIVTLRNTTTKNMKIKLEISSKEIPDFKTQLDVHLSPSEAQSLEFPILIPSHLTEITVLLKAKDEISGALDSMSAKIKISPSIPIRIMQATLFQLDPSYSVPIQAPQGALSGKGGITVIAQSKLAGSLASVQSYMEDYPYSCLEQQISRAIVLGNKETILNLIEKLPSYFDSKGLLKFFPLQQCGSPLMTRYIYKILTENNFEIPVPTLQKLQSGLLASINGTGDCQNHLELPLKNNYGSEEKVLILETLSQMKSFNSSMLSLIKVTPIIWKTETLVAFFELLKRETALPQRNSLLKQIDTLLHSRVNFQGTLMNLQQSSIDSNDWEYQWRLFTSKDQEALGIFKLALQEPSWSQDVARVARGAIARLRHGHWDTTIANAWGKTLFNTFSKKYENENITGDTKLSVSENKSLIHWKNNPSGISTFIEWPKETEKKPTTLNITHSGAGKPWVQLVTRAALPLKKPLEMGYSINKEYLPIIQSKQNQWSIGDVINVRITVTATSDQAWVVLRDPIPAGASHLGTGLSGNSQLLDSDPKNRVSALTKKQVKDLSFIPAPWPSEYDEKSLSQLISYASYLPRGKYQLNYRIRLNSSGEFNLPPTRAEAMYAPESFGEWPNETLKVVP